MTAIVGILNKRAAVMAADSAVTVSNDKGVKIYNTETKIFSLSDEHPIGVMIYDNVEFMGTPWELIFNLYRKERGNIACKSVEEYAQAFILFLKENNYFCSDESKDNYLIQDISTYYNMVKDEVFNLLEEDDQSVEDEEAVRENVSGMISALSDVCHDEGTCEEYEDYDETQFANYSKEYFDSLMEVLGEEHLPTDMRDVWQKGFYAHLRSKVFLNGTSTGVVFVGYGEKDIFPSALATVIGGSVDNRLRYYFDTDRSDKITHDKTACVIPFAQGDVMLTMMKGIAPDLYSTIADEVHASMEKAVQQVAEKFGLPNDDQTTEVAAPIIEKIQDEFTETIDEVIRERFTSGIVDTVESFNVEDLVNMAESLISITNLQRHITSSEETVGGPIDVAVITKTRGFQWAKQKKGRL